jgi:hypothetical protein
MAGDGTYHVELESSQNYFTYLPYIEDTYTVQWNRYGMAWLVTAPTILSWSRVKIKYTYLPYIEGAYTVQWNQYGMAWLVTAPTILSWSRVKINIYLSTIQRGHMRSTVEPVWHDMAGDA